MTWEDITSLLIEIDNLQQSLMNKMQNPIIEKITYRNQKYGNSSNLQKRNLNNAILENQIRITPLQVTLLQRVNQEKLTVGRENIYKNMSDNLEKCANYLISQTTLYEKANQIFDIVLIMEDLAQEELKLEMEVKDCEYGKLKSYYNNQLIILLEGDIRDAYDWIKNSFIAYLESLTEGQKNQLLIEYISLSYDRNAFDFFEQFKIMSKIASRNKIDSIDKIEMIYNYFFQLVQSTMLNLIYSQSFTDICNEFDNLLNYKNKDKVKKV